MAISVRVGPTIDTGSQAAVNPNLQQVQQETFQVAEPKAVEAAAAEAPATNYFESVSVPTQAAEQAQVSSATQQVAQQAKEAAKPQEQQRAQQEAAKPNAVAAGLQPKMNTAATPTAQAAAEPADADGDNSIEVGEDGFSKDTMVFRKQEPEPREGYTPYQEATKRPKTVGGVAPTVSGFPRTFRSNRVNSDITERWGSTPDEVSREESEHLKSVGRFPTQNKLEYQRANDALADKADENGNPKGWTLNDKLVVIPFDSMSMSLADCSIGTNDFVYLARIPNSPILQRINEYAHKVNEKAQERAWKKRKGGVAHTKMYKENWTADDFIDPVTAQDSLTELMAFLNNNYCKIGVVKAPIGEGESAQWRYLKMHWGDGIAVHPLVAKQFNADFDGDGAGVEFSYDITRFTEGPGDWVRGTGGHPTFEWDFWAHFESLDKFSAETFAAKAKIDVDAAEQFKQLIHMGLDRRGNKQDVAMERLVTLLETFPPNKRVKILDTAIQMSNEVMLREFNENETYVETEGPIIPMDTMERQQSLKSGSAGTSMGQYEEAQFRQNEDLDKGSVAFRADGVFKAVKMSKRIMQSSVADEVKRMSLYRTRQHSGQIKLAKRAANRAYTGEKNQALNALKRKRVLETVGLPSSYSNMYDWWVRFYPEYNEYIALKKASKKRFRHVDGRYLKGDTYEYSALKDGPNSIGNLAKAILDIYGDYTIEQVFGSFFNIEFTFSERRISMKDGKLYINAAYKNMTLTELSYDTTLMRKATSDQDIVSIKPPRWYSEEQYGAKAKEYNEKAASDAAKEQADLLYGILSGISQTQMGKSHKLHKSATDALGAVLDTYKAYWTSRERVPRYKKEQFADDLSQLDAKLFSFFDAGYSEGFLECPYMRLFLGTFESYTDTRKTKNRNPGRDYMGIILSMKAVKAFAPLNTKLREYNEIDSRNAWTRQNKWEEVLEECERLSSQSRLMQLIIREVTNGDQVFKHLKACYENGGHFRDPEGSRVSRNICHHDKNYDGVKMYAADFDQLPQTDSLLELLCDPEVPAPVKESWAADCMRYLYDNKYFDYSTLLFELEFDDNAEYKDPSKDAWKKLYDKMKSAREVTEDRNAYTNKQERLNLKRPWVDTWSSSGDFKAPSQEVEDLLPAPWNPTVPEEVCQMSIIQALSPSYGSSEKAGNEDYVKQQADGMKFAYEGGLHSDTFYVDQNGCRTYNVRDLTKHIIAKIANRAPKSEQMLQIVDDWGQTCTLDLKGFWAPDWMRQPSEVRWTKDGTAYMGRIPSKSESEILHSRIMTALFNDPSFSGIIGGMMKERIHNRVEVEATQWALMHMILEHDYPPFDNEWVCNQVAKRWTEWRKLIECLPDNFIWRTYSYKQLGYPEAGEGPGIVHISSYNFMHCRELINRGKIPMSTALEGAETSRKCNMFGWLSSQPDYFYEDDNGEVQPYDEADIGKTKGSAGAPASVMRAMGGEALNLKVAKKGIDKTNSMAKLDKQEDYATATGGYVQQWQHTLKTWEDLRDDTSMSETLKLMECGKIMGEYIHDQLRQKQYTFSEEDREDSRETVYDYISRAQCYNLAMAELKVDAEGNLHWLTQDQVRTLVERKLAEYTDEEFNSFTQDKWEEIYNEAVDGAKLATIPIRPRSDTWWMAYIRGDGYAAEEYQDKTDTRALGWSDERIQHQWNEIVESQPHLRKVLRMGFTPDYVEKHPDKVAEELVRMYGETPIPSLHMPNTDQVCTVLPVPPKGAPEAERKEWSKAQVRVIERELKIAYLCGTRFIVPGQMLRDYLEAYNPDLLPYTERVSYHIPDKDGKTKMMDCQFIDFFGYRMNSLAPYKSGEWLHHPGDSVGHWEDPINFYGNGDSSIFAHKPVLENVKVFDKDVKPVDLHEMFEDEINEYRRKADIRFRIATEEEVKMLATGELGLVTTDEAMDVKFREWRYVNEACIATGVPQPYKADGICGFAAMDIYDGSPQPRTVLKPIIAFELKQINTKTAPRYYTVSSITINGANADVSWSQEGIQEGQYSKVFDGTDFANKMMLFFKALPGDGYDDMGVSLGCVLGAPTTSGRRQGTNMRKSTYASMFLDCYEPVFSYNLGNCKSSFPGNPELKRRVIQDAVGFDEWWDIIDDVEFHTDRKMSNFIRMVCKRCLANNVNPSHFLGTAFNTTEDTNRSYWRMSTYAFDPWILISWDYAEVDMYLKFMYMVHDKNEQVDPYHGLYSLYAYQQQYCPNGIEDETDGNCYYEMAEGEDYGVMRKVYTYYNPDGTINHRARINYHRQYMVHNDDYSGFHIPGVDGARYTPQQLYAAMQNGKKIGDKVHRKWAKSARAGLGNVGKRHCNEMWMDRKTWDTPTDATWNGKKANWDPEVAVSFTGHRPKFFNLAKMSPEEQSKFSDEDIALYSALTYNRSAGWRTLYKLVYAEIERCYKKGKRVFINGGAQGFDQIAAQACLDFQKKHEDVRVIMAVPFESHGSNWKDDNGPFSRSSYMKMRGACEEYILFQDVNDGIKNAPAQRLNARNTWMAANSSTIISFDVGKETGGTRNAVDYAKRRGMPVTNLNNKWLKAMKESKEEKKEEPKPQPKPKPLSPKQAVEAKEKEKPKVIDSFRGEYDFLSNMYECEVHDVGTEQYEEYGPARSVENAFQAEKLATYEWLYGDKDDWYIDKSDGWSIDLYDLVRNKMTPLEARKFGRSIPFEQGDIQFWLEKRDKVMQRLVEAKFNPVMDVAYMLKATDGSQLVEGNTWGDTYWGVSNGKGLNKLGKLLEEQRDKLLKGKASQPTILL